MWGTKATQPLPCAADGIFLSCSFALFLLHLISLKYALQLAPLPKDLFMEAESLNLGSLSSSEAVRRQLLMSILMTLPQPGERLKHLCAASSRAEAPAALNSRFGGSQEGLGVEVGGLVFCFLVFCFFRNEGLLNVFKENKDEWDKQPRVAKLSSCWRKRLERLHPSSSVSPPKLASGSPRDRRTGKPPTPPPLETKPEEWHNAAGRKTQRQIIMRTAPTQSVCSCVLFQAPPPPPAKDAACP